MFESVNEILFLVSSFMQFGIESVDRIVSKYIFYFVIKILLSELFYTEMF